MCQETHKTARIRSNYYIVWNPGETELELYDNRNDAINAAECIVQVARGEAFRTGSWPDWVVDVCVGKVELLPVSVAGDRDIGGTDYELTSGDQL